MSILGIDLAKVSYQVTLFHAQQTHRRSFPNDAAAFADLTHWLQQQGVTALHACMEATGRYGEPLATYLHAQGYTVSVVNPAQIKHYAKSQLRRNKTDKVDADVIAHFAQTQQPSGWQPTAPAIRELTELLHQYDALQAARQQENQRLQAGVHSDAVRQWLTKHLAFLDAQLAEVLRLESESNLTHFDSGHRRPHRRQTPNARTPALRQCAGGDCLCRLESAATRIGNLGASAGTAVQDGRCRDTACPLHAGGLCQTL